MGFLNSLIGGENNVLTMILALAIVLALIVLAVWLLKVLSQTTNSLSRGRQKRLAVIDSVAIDQKRQAVIVRRDDVEHLIVIGGPNDLVVETGFEAPPLPAVTTRPGRRGMSVVKREVEAKPEAGDLGAANKPQPTSLRHTGLFRGTSESTDELPGGKPDRTSPHFSDSDTNDLGTGRDPEPENVLVAGESDKFGSGTGKR